jgi:hypothetical protein
MRFSLLTMELSGRRKRFAIVAADRRPTRHSKRFNSVCVYGLLSMRIVRPSRAAWRLMYQRGEPVCRTMPG